MLKKTIFLVPFVMILSSCGDNSSSSNLSEPILEVYSSSEEADATQFDNSSCSEPIIDSSYNKNDGSSDSEQTSNSSSSRNGDSSSSEQASNSSSSGNGDLSSSEQAPNSSSGGNGDLSSSEQAPNSSSSVNEDLSSSEQAPNSSSSELNVESSSSLNSIYDAANNILTDLRDNQEYKTVTIGEQIWMAENLNYMPEDTVGTMFSGATVCGGGEEGVIEDSKKCHIFGRLYLRTVALPFTDTSRPIRQGICPDGWSIPKKEDWEKLIDYLGENAIAKMKIDDVFMWPNSEHTNESGFSLKPAGVYFNSFGYDLVSRACVYHYRYKDNPYFITIKDENDGKNFEQGVKVMVSVRCLKD